MRWYCRQENKTPRSHWRPFTSYRLVCAPAKNVRNPPSSSLLRTLRCRSWSFISRPKASRSFADSRRLRYKPAQIAGRSAHRRQQRVANGFASFDGDEHGPVQLTGCFRAGNLDPAMSAVGREPPDRRRPHFDLMQQLCGICARPGRCSTRHFWSGARLRLDGFPGSALRSKPRRRL